MIKCNVTVCGIINRDATTRTNKEGKPFFTFPLQIMVPATDGQEKPVEIDVSKDGKITFSTGGMTRMLCPDVMREDEFVEAFNKVDRYQISADGSEVSFLDKAGKVLFKGKK